MSYTFDIVILDIMGVNGFELLKTSVKRGFPTVMLTAYALTPEALEKSIKLGAVSFLPKEKMSDLDEFLADVVLKGGQPVWGKLFDKQNPVLKPPSRSTAKDFDFPYQSLDLKNLTFTGHR
jgi:DNA-binding NarL/FixJ family response regulator